jgi:tetratricopeptide (TPR) repeat protein
MDADLSTICTRIESHLQQNQVDAAAVLLLEHGQSFNERGHAQTTLAFIHQINLKATHTPADLILLQAESHAALGASSHAILLLESAQRVFAELERSDGELRCLLRFAQLYHRREDLEPARLFTEEAVELLRAQPTLDPLLQADTYYALARLAPDIGQLNQGLLFAQESLRFYNAARFPIGQFDAAMLIAAIARQMGRYQMTQAHLTLARRWLSPLAQRPNAHLQLLNTEAHQHWYQGNLIQAEAILRQAIPESDQNPLSKFRVYLRLTLANVLRAQAHYVEAEKLYKETTSTVKEADFALFQVWVEANWSWSNILQGEYALARRRLFHILETTDKGQAASFNASLGILYSLTRRPVEAEQLLRDSLHFYQTSGDELSIFALRFHLAYTYLQTGRIDRAEDEIALALGWAAQWNIDYFPNWWHPQIVATVCAHAFVADLHPGLAERILVKRLGEAAIPVLRRLEQDRSPLVRRRVEDVLALLDVEPLAQLIEPADDTVHRVLAELLSAGRLRRQKLPDLARLLSTTRQDERANPVLLATFGLYVHGAGRREIAEKLHRAERTIRNYIGDIYERFGLDGAGRARQSRFRQLRKLAVEAGYIPGEEGT